MKIIKNKQLIGFFCKSCKSHNTKTAKYLIRRFKEGKTDIFCSRVCADTHHSKSMRGENNPNYNGKWNGPPVSEIFTKEQLRENTLRYIGKIKESGEFDTRMKKLQEGHSRYFSTAEGKEKRRKIGTLGAIAACDGRRTSIEIKMAEELDRRGINYIEQRNLNDKFLLDFMLPEYNIVIECDGDYWHTRPEAIRRDKRKNAYVKACGFSMYRFWEHEINTDVEACVDMVLAEINERRAITWRNQIACSN